ncbi:hypothetical protein [Brevundimonas vesicularis]|jgi:hypothetical protein|uniref:Uncharacterized protein n=1 Tax=Brevundimonas vesicularis TaxID=41276 RepID=A0A1Z3UC27_BREVE|nr:hypothetical protein [Brevundimonas vesicularis]ASE40795.1 hypothetical protein CEP68_15595 [Brevundimonas vesicularis]
MKDDIPNIIATCSLLLAVITALMSFWYADVAKAIGETEPKLPGERRTLRHKIRPVFWTKALPLALGATAIAIVFFARACKIAIAALQGVGRLEYDDMQAAFLVTEGLMVILAGVTIKLAWQLGWKIERLRHDA